MRQFLILAWFLLAASAAVAQTPGCQGGTSPATCQLDWSAQSGRISLPATSAAATDCTVKLGTTTLFAGVVGPGSVVSFSVAGLTSLPLEREVTAFCQNAAGVGGTSFALVTFPDGRVPDAPVLQ